MSSRDLSRTAQGAGLGFLENEEAFDSLEKELLEEPHTIPAGGEDCSQEKGEILEHLGNMKTSVKRIGNALKRMKEKIGDSKVVAAIESFFEKVKASVNRFLDRVKEGLINAWNWISEKFDKVVDFITGLWNSIF